MVTLVDPDTRRMFDIHFGSRGMLDFTTDRSNQAGARRKRYLARHKKREDWTDPTTAGFWSRWILWEKRSVEDAINNALNRFPSLNAHPELQPLNRYESAENRALHNRAIRDPGTARFIESPS